MFIYPYMKGSQSVKALKGEIGAKIIRREGSRFRGRLRKKVVNWGSSTLPPEVLKSRVLNGPDGVAAAANKHSFMRAVGGDVSIPQYTTDKEKAYEWLTNGIVVRETLTGYGGQGIVLLENEEDFNVYNHHRAKLYVEYVPKKWEYRVHIFQGQVLDVQRKGIKKGFEGANWKIRNHENGFIYLREGVEAPEEVLKESIGAVNILGLDFGAVDTIYDEKQQKAYVLEVNTAPGLQGTTLKNYAQAFLKEESWQGFA